MNANKLGTLGDITAALTVLAALPYELGQVTELIPAQLKPWVAGIGILATLALRLMKRFAVAKKALVEFGQPKK